MYGRGKKSEVPYSRLLSSTNKQCKKVMVSVAISLYGVNKPFFVNSNGIKVNQKTYCRHLDKELFPAIEKVVKSTYWIFAQDGAPSHRANTVQDYLTRKLKRRFIRAEEFVPPSSPDLNPLDYFYWDLVKRKVYEGRHGNAFESENALGKNDEFHNRK